MSMMELYDKNGITVPLSLLYQQDFGILRISLYGDIMMAASNLSAAYRRA